MAVVNFVDQVLPNELGTPLDRLRLMAIQGFGGATTVFGSDGSITETFADGVRVTTFNSNGSITETFTATAAAGGQSMTKTTTFNSDGSISEVIS